MKSDSNKNSMRFTIFLYSMILALENKMMVQCNSSGSDYVLWVISPHISLMLVLVAVKLP